jgi:hypothetical protein
MKVVVTGAGIGANATSAAKFGEGRGYCLNSPERVAAGASQLLAIRWLISTVRAFTLMQTLQTAPGVIIEEVSEGNLLGVEEVNFAAPGNLTRYLLALLPYQAGHDSLPTKPSEPSEVDGPEV